jgi:hypothetical protein
VRRGKINLRRAVVAITGGGRGIGAATASAFAARGARVCIGDLDTDAAHAVAVELGHRVKPFRLDVTSAASFAEFADAATAACGPIDVLVNNAGIMPAGSFVDESPETAAAVIDVNLRGPLLGMKLVLPGMLERGRGHVVNVASYAGRIEIPGLATYCASKHGLVGLTGTVARELEGTGVTVSAVLPSAVETELASGIPFPFARFAKVHPDDVAEAIVATVRDRPREVAVPRWLSSYEQLRALLPDRVEGVARWALGDDRALTRVDHEARAAYEERLARQADGRGP